MSNDPAERPSEVGADLAREIQSERKFSLSEAIGRLAGAGMMKGVSPVTRKQQAEAEIQEYLGRHLADTAGALPGVLLRQVGESNACSTTSICRSSYWPVMSEVSSAPSTS